MSGQHLNSSLVLPREWVRELDRRAIAEYGIPGVVLMENAGRGAADVLERLGINGPVVICCGKGNNAGDGFVIARHLDFRGYPVQIVMAIPGEELSGDAALNYQIVRRAQLPLIILREDFEDMIASCLASADWIVDALLGTGAQGEPKPPFDAIVRAINRAHQLGKKVLAVDLPSGLDCDSGRPSQATIQADHTVTFAAIKPGLISELGRQFVGQVHVVDIGVPRRLINEILEQWKPGSRAS
ncbi:MAG: NAD(P)H-hydrate epimerase [Thermogutta sp.]